MSSDGFDTAKQFATQYVDEGIYNADSFRKADVKDVIRGFQSYIPLRLPFCFYTWAWCRSVAPSRQKRIRRLEAKSERLTREKLDIARLIRVQSRFHLVE